MNTYPQPVPELRADGGVPRRRCGAALRRVVRAREGAGRALRAAPRGVDRGCGGGAGALGRVPAVGDPEGWTAVGVNPAEFINQINNLPDPHANNLRMCRYLK